MDNHEDEIDINCFVNNLHLCKEAKTMYNQMEPVEITFKKLQNDNANIADGCEIYQELFQNKKLIPNFSKMKSSFDKTMTPLSIFWHSDESRI